MPSENSKGTPDRKRKFKMNPKQPKLKAKTNEQAQHHLIPEEKEWGATVEGHSVVSLKEGTQVGDISNIYISLIDKKISAFEIRKTFWGERYFVYLNDVIFIGEDMIFINENKNVFPLNELNKKKHRNLHDLRGARITSLNGKKIGMLEDIDVSMRSHEIKEFSLGQGKKLPVNLSEITIGEDEILVPTDYESKIIKLQNDVEKKPSYTESIIANISKTLHLNRNNESTKNKSRPEP